MIAGYGFYFHPLQVTTTENIKILKIMGSHMLGFFLKLELKIGDFFYDIIVHEGGGACPLVRLDAFGSIKKKQTIDFIF